LEVFGTTGDGRLFHMWQIVPNGDCTNAVEFFDPEPAPSVTITADCKQIIRGESTNLSWSSANAVSLDIEPDVGSVSARGSRSVSPKINTTYKITATGFGGSGTASDTQLITVVEPAGETTTRVELRVKPAEEGPPFVGVILPVQGGVLKSITNANSEFKPNNGMFLLKFGHGSSECNNSNAVIPLAQGKTWTDMKAVFGGTDLSNGVTIVACTAATDLEPMFVDVTYSHPGGTRIC
jgi:hypothetical protein